MPPDLFGGGKDQGKETSTDRFMFIRERPSPSGLYLVVLKGHILSVPKSDAPTLEFVEGSHLMPISEPPPCAKIKRHGHLTLEKASSVLHFSVPLLPPRKSEWCCPFSEIGPQGRIKNRVREESMGISMAAVCEEAS